MQPLSGADVSPARVAMPATQAALGAGVECGDSFDPDARCVLHRVVIEGSRPCGPAAPALQN